MRLYRNNRYQSFQYRKKLFYVFSSLLLSIGLLFTGMFDLIFLLDLERPDITTHSGLLTVLILHVVSFYLALFGFAHCYESKFYILSCLALVGGGLTLVSLLMRIVLELVLVGFYPSSYAVT